MHIDLDGLVWMAVFGVCVGLPLCVYELVKLLMWISQYLTMV
jgi:hypothetical protein